MKIYPPVLGVRLLPHPYGHVYQEFGKNKELYARAIVIPGCGLSNCSMWGGHNGVDIAMAFRTPILATKGKVVEIKNTPEGYGKHLRILTDLDEHGKQYELTYGHLDEITAVLGMKVADGERIGYMGNTGFVISGSTPYWGNAPAGKGVHLHFGVREVVIGPLGFLYQSGDRVTVLNYDNGTFGSINPMRFFDRSKEVVYLAGVVIDLQYKFLALLRPPR